MDGNTAAKGGNGRRGAANVILASAVAIVALVAVVLPPSAALRRLWPPDIHSEYVKFLSGRDTVTAYIAYPERPQPAPAVIVIHEIFGMSDFIRQTTEQLAKDGFVAIAPDLLSRRGGTPASQDSARKLIATLNADTVTQDLDATRRYLNSLLPVRANEIGVIGFCWGGGQSFRYATNAPELKAFVVCYGPSPNPADMAKIRPKRPRRCAPPARIIRTPSIRASGTASCARASSPRLPTAPGMPCSTFSAGSSRASGGRSP